MKAVAAAVATATGEPPAGGHGHSELRAEVLAGFAQRDVDDCHGVRVVCGARVVLLRNLQLLDDA
eukprot:899854-Pyramimonas_sp.AAC.1